MTEKISAGYFDSNRGEPIYVGDVYKEEGAMIPYHKVIKDPEKGFMVEHVGTTEKFSLTSEAKHLINRTYLGNIYDTPDWDELVGNKPAEEEKNSEEVKDEAISENTPDDVKEFLHTDSITPEPEKEDSTEPQSEDTGDEVVSAAATTGPKDEEEKEDDSETADNEQKEPENEQNTADDEQKAVNDEQNGSKNEQNEAATPIDVIASNKEEKNLQEKRNDYQKHIDALKRKNDELETEAVRYENLASTLDYQPFVELKMLTSNAVQDYAKKQDIKECEKHLKNYKTIDSIEALLKEYEDMAEKNRSNIELNNKDIDNYEVKIAEINDKLNNFQRKLALNAPVNESKAEQ